MRVKYIYLQTVTHLQNKLFIKQNQVWGDCGFWWGAAVKTLMGLAELEGRWKICSVRRLFSRQAVRCRGDRWFCFGLEHFPCLCFYYFLSAMFLRDCKISPEPGWKPGCKPHPPLTPPGSAPRWSWLQVYLTAAEVPGGGVFNQAQLELPNVAKLQFAWNICFKWV